MNRTTLFGARPDVPAGDVGAALAVAPTLCEHAALLGRETSAYFGLLRELGAFDLTTARTLEPHLDALTILAEAGVEPLDLSVGVTKASTWGVFASRAPELRAEHTGAGWRLSGTKPWCSLADRLTHALVTVGTPEGQRLFALGLDDSSVHVSSAPWVARGLSAVRSPSVTFVDTPAEPVGEPGFYLGRDGFAWGGVGVAAIWAGAVDALTRTVTNAAERREPDQIALMHLGRLSTYRHVLDVTLADAASRIDAGQAAGTDGSRLAAHARAVVAEVAENALSCVGHALGPGPLTGDEEHARRVADLTVYLRQHHAERDLAAIGATVLEGTGE